MKYKIRTFDTGERIKYRIDDLMSYPGDDFIIAETWEWNVYIKDSWRMPKNSLIIDIGAHIGAFSIYCSTKYSPNSTYAYEPFPENYNLMKENIRINNIKNIKTFQYAITNEEGTKSLFLDNKSNAGHSLIKRSRSSINIRTMTLEQIFFLNNISHCDLLKLDCEGSEFEIIKHTSQNTLRKVRYLSLEFHEKILDKNIHLPIIIDKLKQVGFNLSFINYQKLFLPLLFEQNN
jgi:FkbM family methyltransferase